MSLETPLGEEARFHRRRPATLPGQDQPGVDQTMLDLDGELLRLDFDFPVDGGFFALTWNLVDDATNAISEIIGAGIQALKAGLMEIADVFAVNKADRPGVDDTIREVLRGCRLHLDHYVKGLGAAAALLDYLAEMRGSEARHVTSLQRLRPRSAMTLDPSTLHHLDIVPRRGEGAAGVGADDHVDAGDDHELAVAAADRHRHGTHEQGGGQVVDER